MERQEAQDLKFKMKTRTSYLGSDVDPATCLLLSVYWTPTLRQVLRKQGSRMKSSLLSWWLPRWQQLGHRETCIFGEGLISGVSYTWRLSRDSLSGSRFDLTEWSHGPSWGRPPPNVFLLLWGDSYFISIPIFQSLFLTDFNNYSFFICFVLKISSEGIYHKLAFMSQASTIQTLCLCFLNSFSERSSFSLEGRNPSKCVVGPSFFLRFSSPESSNTVLCLPETLALAFPHFIY